jgi:hypothetical protein
MVWLDWLVSWYFCWEGVIDEMVWLKWSREGAGCCECRIWRRGPWEMWLGVAPNSCFVYAIF